MSFSLMGALGSSALDYDLNRKMMKKQIDYSAEVSNRYFREQRQSAYQDTMGDMEKAGLNPILAYSQGPTSSSGVSLQAQNPVPYAGNAFNNALSGANSAVDRKLKRTQERLADREDAYKMAQTSTEVMKRHVMRFQKKKLQFEAAHSAVDLDVKEAYLESVLNRAKVNAKSKDLQWLDRIGETVGKILGNGNSAVDLYKKTQ